MHGKFKLRKVQKRRKKNDGNGRSPKSKGADDPFLPLCTLEIVCIVPRARVAPRAAALPYLLLALRRKAAAARFALPLLARTGHVLAAAAALLSGDAFCSALWGAIAPAFRLHDHARMLGKLLVQDERLRLTSSLLYSLLKLDERHVDGKFIEGF